MLFVFALGFSITPVSASSTTFSITQGDLNDVNNYAPFYDSNGACSDVSGGGLPDGADFPNLDPASMATAINSWMRETNPSGELVGLGTTIVADAQHSNVSPFLIVAIANKESNLGDPTTYNVINGDNSFGRTAVDSQPHFAGAGVNTGTLWYKWTSVKNSVDYTAPENQNKPYGGDFAAYLRAEYGKDLDGNSIVSLMEAYAPPSANDTALYISQVRSWVSAMINLTQGSAATSSTSTGCSVSANCSQAAVNTQTADLSTIRQNVVCIAQKQLAIWESQPGYPWNGTNSFSESYYLHYEFSYPPGNPEEWCADFASWVYNQAGDPFNAPDWDYPGVIDIYDLGIENKSFTFHDLSKDPNYTPVPGDLAIHSSAGYPFSHVNIVVSVTSSSITLIGGDQGNGPYPGGSIVSTETVIPGQWQDIIGFVSPNG